jgi:hypothetical protein
MEMRSDWQFSSDFRFSERLGEYLQQVGDIKLTFFEYIIEFD